MPRATASHYSRLAAIDTLRALRSLGGRGTTRQIRRLTDSEAVHTDIHAVRCFCRARGMCPGENPVRTVRTGKTARGRHVIRYHLALPVLAAMRQGWPFD